MTWRTAALVVGRWLLALVLVVGDVVVAVTVGTAIDDFLTAQLGAFESRVTGYVVLLTGVAAWWANRTGTRRKS